MKRGGQWQNLYCSISDAIASAQEMANGSRHQHYLIQQGNMVAVTGRYIGKNIMMTVRPHRKNSFATIDQAKTFAQYKANLAKQSRGTFRRSIRDDKCNARFYVSLDNGRFLVQEHGLDKSKALYSVRSR